MDGRNELRAWILPSGGESWRNVLVFVEICFCLSKVLRAVQTYRGRTKSGDRKVLDACKFESSLVLEHGCLGYSRVFSDFGEGLSRDGEKASPVSGHFAMGILPITGTYFVRSNVFSSDRKLEALRVNRARPISGMRSPLSDKPASWRFLLTSELTQRILRSWILL